MQSRSSATNWKGVGASQQVVKAGSMTFHRGCSILQIVFPSPRAGACGVSRASVRAAGADARAVPVRSRGSATSRLLLATDETGSRITPQLNLCPCPSPASCTVQRPLAAPIWQRRLVLSFFLPSHTTSKYYRLFRPHTPLYSSSR